MADENSISNKGDEGDGGEGRNGPTDIPEESVSTESNLSLSQQVADRQSEDEQGNK